MSESATQQAKNQPDELAAFITDLYGVTHGLNQDVRQSLGQAAPISPPSTDIGSPYEIFARPPSNQPTWNMLTTSAAHVLLHHVLPAKEGPLAAMGERARKHQELLTSLGEKGLAGHLHLQLGGILMQLSHIKLWGKNRTALNEILVLNEYRRSGGPDSAIVFGGIRSLLRKDRRQVRRALQDIIFTGNYN